MRSHLKRAAKAYVAALVSAGSFLAPVIDDGLLASEAIGAFTAGLVAWQAVYWTPNARRTVKRITAALRGA